MEDWDDTICDYLMDPKAKKIKAIHLLTPEEVEDAHMYKSWQYFKSCQRDLTDQWKTFSKLRESYTAEEKPEEQTKSEGKRTNKKQKRSVTGQNHLHH